VAELDSNADNYGVLSSQFYGPHNGRTPAEYASIKWSPAGQAFRGLNSLFSKGSEGNDMLQEGYSSLLDIYAVPQKYLVKAQMQDQVRLQSPLLISVKDSIPADLERPRNGDGLEGFCIQHCKCSLP
jgi:hypothetical protein